MIEELISLELLTDVGFPIFVACVLIYDKIRTNGSLLKVVENNNKMLSRIENLVIQLCAERGKL